MTDWDEYGNRLLGRNRLVLEHHQEVVRVFVRHFSEVDLASSILDVGCGGGFFLEILRNLGLQDIQGVDPSATMVARAKQKNLNVEQGSVWDLKDDGQWDVILLMEVCEHLEVSPLAILSRALKPGGELFVTIPVYDDLKHRFERFLRRVPKVEQAKRHDETHIRGLSKAELVRGARDSGLALVKARHCWNPCPLIRSRTIRRLVGRWLDCGMFLVAVFKKTDEE